MPYRRRLAALSTAAALLTGPSNAQSTVLDPLPSWSDGASKQAVFEFVDRVTTPGPDFVQPSERVAVFDNGGQIRQARNAPSPTAGRTHRSQLELLAYLRVSGFRTLFLSTGDLEFTRAPSEAGDQAMLQYTSGRDGPALALLVHHDDARRDVASTNGE